MPLVCIFLLYIGKQTTAFWLKLKIKNRYLQWRKQRSKTIWEVPSLKRSSLKDPPSIPLWPPTTNNNKKNKQLFSQNGHLWSLFKQDENFLRRFPSRLSTSLQHPGSFFPSPTGVETKTRGQNKQKKEKIKGVLMKVLVAEFKGE